MKGDIICILVLASLCALPFYAEACRCLPYDNIDRISSSLNCYDGALARFVVLNSRSAKFNGKPAFLYKTALQEVYYDSTNQLQQRVGESNFTVIVQQTGSSCDFRLTVGSLYISKLKAAGSSKFLVPGQCEKTNVDLTTSWATLNEALSKAEFSCNPCLNNPCEEGQTCTAQSVNCIKAPCWPIASCKA
eukprot:TRINITY_DN1427_c0_g1_i2.p1 TRINITY_DN1427_c0_g1~~TRINITY_DN1427_c0_g1_i2.p1  ORF type:complete len:190 (-),score=35.50 TRINITY_DN1427_c0_g1_i2:92-661(-)